MTAPSPTITPSCAGPAVHPTGPAPGVVLVKTSPERIVQGDWYRMPLLGIGYLAAYLRRQGVAVRIVDAMFDRLSLDETVRRVVEGGPRLVGFTAMTHEAPRAAEVARGVREASPGVRIVVGGPHASALPGDTLREFPEFDFAVFGEGEETLWELYRTVEREDAAFETIAGLAFRRGDEVVVNPPREWVRDLDALPFPAWDLYGPSGVYQMYASRGCPFQCIFCMRVLGEKVRVRSPRNVVDEFEEVVERYAPARIDFSDETFAMRRDWVIEICDEIVRRGLHRRVEWFANGRVNTVDGDLLDRMREAGCVRIGYGIESGNAEILKVARKATTVEQIEKAIAATKAAGLEIEAFYIVGFPGETVRTALDTIRLAARLATTTAAFGIMVPYPGTAVAEMAAAGEGGYRLLSRDWTDYDKHLGHALELETLSRRNLELLQMAGYLWFYARNLRFGALAQFIWEKRKAVARMAKKTIGMR
ncbi:cobalamin-dependent protein [Candidatus Sumerlaeota bacterium]|nr:cobalamin-dependent protein [Candidatus Sumerlaeota bacterium]